MNCERAIDLIDAFVDGELADDVLTDFTAHLSACEDCSKELELVQRENELLETYHRRIEPPESLWNDIHAALTADEQQVAVTPNPSFVERISGVFSRLAMPIPAMALSCALLIVVGLFTVVVPLLTILIVQKSRFRTTE